MTRYEKTDHFEKFAKIAFLSPFDANFMAIINHAINMLYDRVMTQKMYPGHPSTCHQFLEKRSVKVVRTLTFNVSVYLYVGPCHTRAVCAR